MVLRDSFRMILVGLLMGLPTAYMVARFLKASLFELEPVDPLSAGVALMLLLLLVALTGALLPVRRAAGVDPVTALREE